MQSPYCNTWCQKNTYHHPYCYLHPHSQTTTIITGSTEYSGLLNNESRDKARKPNYSMIKSYVLTRGLVTLTESTRKTSYSNYFNRRECDTFGCLKRNWRSKKDKWEHPDETDSNHRKQLPPGEGPRDKAEVSRTQKFGGRAPQVLYMSCSKRKDEIFWGHILEQDMFIFK